MPSLHTTKIILACVAAAVFLILGVLDLYIGAHPGHPVELRVGIASLCLGIANGLLLLPW